MTLIPEALYATQEAEASLLGAILIESSDGNREAIDEVCQIIGVDDFLDFTLYDAKHARIFSAMVLGDGAPNQIVVAEEMNRRGLLRSGDCAYLRHLVAECPCSLDFPSYTQAVRDYADRRKGKARPRVRGGAKL